MELSWEHFLPCVDINFLPFRYIHYNILRECYTLCIVIFCSSFCLLNITIDMSAIHPAFKLPNYLIHTT